MRCDASWCAFNTLAGMGGEVKRELKNKVEIHKKKKKRGKKEKRRGTRCTLWCVHSDQ